MSGSRAHDFLTRAILGLAAAGALLLLARGDWQSLGVLWRPTRGWRYWGIVSVIAAGAILAFSLVVLIFVPRLWDITVERGSELWQSDFLDALIFSCVKSPAVEELLYRAVLCASLVQAIGRIPTVVVSGLSFAALHFIYGNPGPDNAVAGFLLAWAYLVSDSFAIPLLMHAGGNLLVLLLQLAVSALTGAGAG
ncbi:MAG TPA: CPBP family intramembrane glutamic endopeptidase [Polyangiaceae bacterium]|nr:CPBP family intramembrane glutamic endopeptidase [Polyangiaceae bacterium]